MDDGRFDHERFVADGQIRLQSLEPFASAPCLLFSPQRALHKTRLVFTAFVHLDPVDEPEWVCCAHAFHCVASCSKAPSKATPLRWASVGNGP
jgi:hypothetical protein